MIETTAITQPKILILLSTSSDAHHLTELMRRESMMVEISTRFDDAQANFERCQPDVLVLVFRELDEAEKYYHNLMQASEFARSHPHRTLVLCRTEDVPAAYEKCVNGIFSDYMQFWPMTFDAYRLPMSIRHAQRDLQMSDVLARLQVERAAAAEKPPATEPKLATVLVIEDDEFQQKILHRMVTQENMLCKLAGSGYAALSELEEIRPDLILLDYQLPDTDGIKLLHKLRSMPTLANVPVIMLTGNGDKNIVIACLKAGANDYLVKPVSAISLRDRLQKFQSQATLVA